MASLENSAASAKDSENKVVEFLAVSPVNPERMQGQTIMERNGSLSLGIVIATRHRPVPLRECLDSIATQTALPTEIVIVDSSVDTQTQDLVQLLQSDVRIPCKYRHSSVASAAQQRNLGISMLDTDLVLFLDDDVVLEPGFISEILMVFGSDADGRLGGVSGTITNQVYSDPEGFNRFLLGFCLGRFNGTFAGKVLGPAVNFLPADGPVPVQEVEWLPSGCTAYRRDILLTHQFETTFQGYSFAEDLHLSTRIARDYRLLNTTRARLFHADLGKDTHRDWAALGESQVRNRHLIMTSVLQRNRVIDHIRLFAFEVIYTTLALLSGGINRANVSRLTALMRGKIRAFVGIWTSTNRP